MAAVYRAPPDIGMTSQLSGAAMGELDIGRLKADLAILKQNFANLHDALSNDKCVAVLRHAGHRWTTHMLIMWRHHQLLLPHFTAHSPLPTCNQSRAKTLLSRWNPSARLQADRAHAKGRVRQCAAIGDQGAVCGVGAAGAGSSG